MEALTLIIAIVGSGFALFLRPVHALGIYCLCLFAYPQPLAVRLGTLDFSTGRIVILFLLANAIFRRGLWRGLKWDWLDTLFMATFVGSTFAVSTTMPSSVWIERQGGAFFDIVFIYAAVRLIIRSKQDLLIFIRWLVVIGVPIAALALYQALTGHNPIAYVRDYVQWEGKAAALAQGPEKRMGLWRSAATLDVPIVMGLYFAALAPMCLGLWSQRVWSKGRIVFLTGVMLVGVLCSASSAPLFAIATTAMMLSVYKFRRFWPVLAVVALIGCLFIEVYSNRHFYHVLTRLALNPETAYYRIRLFETAFGGGLDGHWTFGYGYVGLGPGNFNALAGFTWETDDLVNIYIDRLVKFGLVGTIPFALMNVLYFRRLYEASKYARSEADKFLLWAFASALVGWNVSLMTVSALNQAVQMLSIMIAICCAYPLMMRDATHAVAAPAPTRIQLRQARTRSLAPRRPRLGLRRRNA